MDAFIKVVEEEAAANIKNILAALFRHCNVALAVPRLGG
jgi:hypothetical protein